MAFLILTAPLPPADASGEYVWARGADDGASVLDHGRAALALLPSGSEVALGIPAAAISWHRLTLPKGSMVNAARLRSVLDGLLEDQLLDEPESLHFALEPGARVGVPVWIAACNRIWLRAIVNMLEGSGRRVMRIVPEFAPTPLDAAPRLFAVGEPGNAQLVCSDEGGVVALPLTPAGLSMAAGLPLDSAVCSAEPAVAGRAEELLGRRLPIVQPPQRWMEAARQPWDLAQFDLAVTGRARAGKKVTSVLHILRHHPAWRAARWGAAVLVLVQLVGLNAWAWKERQALDNKRQAVNAILTQTFPAVQVVIDAPLQMEREVAALRQATGEVQPGDFEPMLAALAPHLPAGKTPAAIDYTAGQLRLRGLGLGAADGAKVASALSPRGYQVRVEGDLLLMQPESTR